MLDPRSRLALACGAAGAVAASGTPWALIGEYLVLLILIGSWRRGRSYLRWLRLVVPMALFFGALSWWAAGALAQGGAAALKLLGLTTVFFLFFEATTPEDLGNSLVAAGLPFSAAFVFSAALQFVPVIGRKARCVIEAQRCRGIALEPAWAALRHWPAFLAPLLIQAFTLADELAEAMEARGFSRPGRTFYRDYRMQPKDWLAVAAGAGLWLAAIWWL
ncbi:MAG TPA: energy-coupling factor transporter transmembrane protein EcfT [Desulfobacteraceae bacterium]|nr:energy-coupling factor transporter transmembrane protein EcfT [Deltaproteobacteria bacterium]MBW2356391.1 energy-coupling factor transporter transmembrane protein EcfT [Deltaproteobacteria bacterium]RLB95668.1 MAG: energy-coupling factor transporter transmembrane protein EcfT [Deltaproteobacteria bacterium]HDI61269.1 energy-coupling factor transporter transmembrane protein EcfT [Desulfobacteraceae bacterium]